jgi:hypothetical protein
LESDREKLLKAKGLLCGDYSNSLEEVSEKYEQGVRSINGVFNAQCPESAAHFIAKAQSAKDDALTKIESCLGTINSELSSATTHRDTYHRARSQQMSVVS